MTVSSKHHVVIIPELGNEVEKHIWVSHGWRKFGVTPHVFDAAWGIEERGLQPKLCRALELVDRLTDAGQNVSLVGNSAGSSLALNIFGERKNKIHRVIINCGRIRTGDWPWFTFAQATSSSPSFKESVLKAEQLESKLTMTERQKIMTIRPFFDEVVPPTTVAIYKASNIVIPSVEHVVSIAAAMLFPSKMIKFILTK